MAAVIARDLWATSSNASFPGPEGAVSVPVWGYSPTPGQCQVPGPLLEAMQGDTLQVTLHNTLPEPVSLIWPGQAVRPVPVKDTNGRFVSFHRHALPGGTFIYTVNATRPGTFRYESGSNPAVQVQMGLSGPLIVRPAGFSPSDPAQRTAYGPDTGSDFDAELLLVLGEVDSRLHTAAASGSAVDLRAFAPDWWVVGGRAYPDTVAPDAPGGVQPLSSALTVQAGRRLLIRCINSGFQTHALYLGGLAGRVIAEDGYPLMSPTLDATYSRHTLTVAPGQSFDIILTSPDPGEFYLYDRELLHCVNGERFPGGMMTRLTFAV